MKEIVSKLKKKGEKVNEKLNKNKQTSEKGAKMEEKGQSLEEQYSNLKKNNPELVEKTKNVAKSDPKSVKASLNRKPSRKGGVKMKDLSPREKCDSVLEKVVKDLKFTTQRIEAKANAKGPGALQVKRPDGVKVAVRTNDVVIYSPQSFIGTGRVAPAGWKHVTVFNHKADLDVLDKAIRKGLKDKKSGSQWAAELGSTGRVKTLADIQDRKAMLEAELKRMKEIEKKMKPKTKIRKPKTSTTPALATA